eukprot:2966372-Amphidinium_carterae.1
MFGEFGPIMMKMQLKKFAVHEGNSRCFLVGNTIFLNKSFGLLQKHNIQWGLGVMLRNIVYNCCQQIPKQIVPRARKAVAFHRVNRCLESAWP